MGEEKGDWILSRVKFVLRFAKAVGEGFVCIFACGEN